MSLCGLIDSGASDNCDEPIQAGAKDRMHVINKKDWDNAAITYNATNKGIIENIVFPGSEAAYVFEGKSGSVAPKSELVRSEYFESYAHENAFKVFAIDATIKDTLMKMDKGLFVTIIENNYDGVDGASSFEVYGVDAGMQTSQNIRDVSNVELGGGFDLILRSREKSLEPRMPKSLFITDYATTKAIVDGLV